MHKLYSHKFIFIYLIGFLLINQPFANATSLQRDSVQTFQPRTQISTNPDISVIGDFQSSYNCKLEKKLDFHFNEVELAFKSAIDPYATADFYFTFGKHNSEHFEASVEEAYLTTLSLPYYLQLKAGKFLMTLGRINTIHPHALPFIDMPNVYSNYFGEALNSEGFSLSWFVPNPLDFFQEITFEVTNVPNENPTFSRNVPNRYFYLTHLKNFWDLNENSTLELGLTGIIGPNDSLLTTSLGALDLTYKWKPLQFGTYHSFVWQSELFYIRAASSESDFIKTFGMYSFMTYQFGKQWFLTGRFDYSNQPFSQLFIERAFSLTLGWYATEFQKIELGLKTTSNNLQERINQAMLRWIFVIGAHGAHKY